MKKTSWEDTRKIFLHWLSNNQLKKKFSNNLCYNNLSLWWLTNLYEKDNINETQWYEDLNKVFFSNKEIEKKKKFSFFLNYLKLTKKFLSSIFFNLFIKVFYSEKLPSKINLKNCIYTLSTNFIEHEGHFIDRQYGLYGLNNKKDVVYFIDVFENFDLIRNYFSNKKKFSKIPFKYHLSEKNLRIRDIIKVYFFCLKKLIKIYFILKKKNYFIIKKKDCSKILKDKVIKSFFGSIQEQLIKGISLNNLLNEKNFKNFINCFDFHPQSRCIFYFAKNSKVKNLININHANYSENNTFFNFKKNEFSINNKDYKNFSPQPDIFFCQGKKYAKKLKKIFDDKKIFTIGSLKIELNKSKLNTKKKFNNKKKKKVIVILCSLNDYHSFIKVLNRCDLKKFRIIIAPHPLKKEKTIQEFKIKFKNNFLTDRNLNKTKLLNSCDYIIFGDTSLGLELSIMKKNIFRIYEKEFVPTFDIDKEVPTATNSKEVMNFLNKKKVTQNSKLIEQNYFYKYDKKASKRFSNILKNF